jgi:hypothetical protein
MNENHTGFQIRQHLNRGLVLKNDTLEGLTAGRKRALERQRSEARVDVLAWFGNVNGYFGAPQSLLQRFVLPLGVLVIGLLAINAWQQTQAGQEIEEIDAAVLTGDLPIDAYLDNGFDAWLKHSSR